LIDWEKNNCVLAGTARNGRQALEAIEALAPDIVLADINMPVMDGLALLEQAQKQSPETVFIMLTNLEEFALAQQALRLRAVDYITKTQMEPETLEKGLAKAIDERNRRRMAAKGPAGAPGEGGLQQQLENALTRFTAPSTFSGEDAALLTRQGFFEGYSALVLFFMPGDAETNDNESGLSRLRWQREVLEKLAQNGFKQYALVRPAQSPAFLLFYWGSQPQSGNTTAGFFQRLKTTSANVTQLRPCVMAAGLHKGEQSRQVFCAELAALQNYFYLTGKEQIDACSLPAAIYQPLGLAGIGSRLKTEIRSRSSSVCGTLIQRTAQQLAAVPHEREQALWVCTTLYRAACDALREIHQEESDSSFFTNTAAGYSEIEGLLTRAQVLHWLKKLENELLGLLEPLSTARGELLEQARRYVYEHLGKKIMLQDVANYACVSAGYLSALFKKEYGQNFIDFVNGAKMEKACQLIADGHHLMSEIGYLLGFENAYYFSKVFRRHTGMSPTEYRQSLGKPQKG
ncbi:MAG: helix-turn-helix domain-containing protein, partial [Oscillospiraceae bacterium]